MDNNPDDQSPGCLSGQHFANLRPGAVVTFPAAKHVWKVAEVVDRGAVLYRADDGSHKHLAEWQELATAKIE